MCWVPSATVDENLRVLPVRAFASPRFSGQDLRD